MTSALTLPTGGQLASSWPETPPGSPTRCPAARPLARRSRRRARSPLRRHIHAHPELSGQEFETAALVARELDAGRPARRGCCPRATAYLRHRRRPTARSIALRADLDALPLPDTKDVPYRSTVDNVCHACGHDVHTTILLGAGLPLAQLAERGELPGRVRLLFQPAEEIMPVAARRRSSRPAA